AATEGTLARSPFANGSEAFVPHCCRIETNPGHPPQDSSPSAAGAEDLDVEVADFLAQSVAVDAQEVGGPDLVATGGRQGHGQERLLDFPQDTMVEAGRRQAVAEASEIGREVALDRGRQTLIGTRLVSGGGGGGLG